MDLLRLPLLILNFKNLNDGHLDKKNAPQIFKRWSSNREIDSFITDFGILIIHECISVHGLVPGIIVSSCGWLNFRKCLRSGLVYSEKCKLYIFMYIVDIFVIKMPQGVKVKIHFNLVKWTFG